MCISETSEVAEGQLSAQTENKMIGGKVGDEISKLCAGQATKMCWRMALLSLYGHTGMEKRLIDEVQTRNTFKHNQTKTCIGETSELTDRQLCAQKEKVVYFQTETKLLVATQVMCPKY